MDWLLQDLRFTFRALARTPAFLAIVILTLGLGIGANAAIFSLLDQALLRQMPVQRPEQLVQLDCPDPCPFQGRVVQRTDLLLSVLRRFPRPEHGLRLA